MELRDVYIELFDRIDQHVASTIDGLDAEQLHWTPESGVNSIGWLVWHLTRVQDSHIAELLDDEQVWVTGDHAARVGVEADFRGRRPAVTDRGQGLARLGDVGGGGEAAEVGIVLAGTGGEVAASAAVATGHDGGLR